VRDNDFLRHVADTLAGLPNVTAVALGGSRATGTHRPHSDWDFAVYYRGSVGSFDPADLRAVGWPGEVSELGGWGGGIFNGGAWLTIDERRTDVHYRDLDDVEHHLAEAQAGRFRIEHLMFYLAGVPTYVVVAELAANRALFGELPAADYPPALRERAAAAWSARAELTLDYAARNHAPAGRLLDCAGAAARASLEAANAILAARGEWITNEKRLLDRAGLRDLDATCAAIFQDPSRVLHELGQTLRGRVLGNS
jgi:predicted nucleotidyltransferase